MKTILTAAALALGAATLATQPAAAHHGWSWTTGENIELTGTVRSAQLGNPHGILELDVDGTMWRVEVGQPWRHDRAGLERDALGEGAEITLVGEPSADGEKRVKVERLSIDGKEYVLYPDRD